MTEEKRGPEQSEEKQVPKEEPKQEEPHAKEEVKPGSDAVSSQAKGGPEPAKKHPTAPPSTPQKPKACTQCGKSLSRRSWYYRNNIYYCSKRCFKASQKKEEKK